jgi:putative ABC transport system substrate-binding protein
MAALLGPLKRSLAIAALALLGAASTVAAAENGKRLRISALVPGPPSCPVFNGASTEAFQRAIREAGYGAAEMLQYCYSSLADVPAQMPRILHDRPDVLLIWGSAIAARAIKDASPTLPVVFVDVADPVRNGLVESLAHPAWNMTGITNITEELAAKRVEILKEAFPSLSRLALLANLSNPDQPRYAQVIEDAARALRIETRIYEVGRQPDLAAAFAAMERDHMQAVLLLPDVWFFPNRVEIVGLAARHRLPAMYGNSAFAEQGGLLVFGANLADMSARAVTYIDKILKGAKPGDLPVERPAKFDFIVNAKTARDIGVTVAPAALLRATRVIE